MARGFRVFPALALVLGIAVGPGALAGADGMAAGERVGNVARGEALFDLCAQCHGAQGQGNADIEAPAIAGLPLWYVENTVRKFKAGGRGTHPEDYAGMRMRPMSMSLRRDEDITHVATYVAQLPPVKSEPLLSGGDATRGAALYAPCIACHMPDGSGNPALQAPPIKHASDWYLLAQLKKFKGGIRGMNPMDPTGALMVGMVQLLADEQAMKDVIAHIMTLTD